MKLTPTNRMISGDVLVRVFDPDTGEPLDPNSTIDLDKETPARRAHFLQILKEGDLKLASDPEPKGGK